MTSFRGYNYAICLLREDNNWFEFIKTLKISDFYCLITFVFEHKTFFGIYRSSLHPPFFKFFKSIVLNGFPDIFHQSQHEINIMQRSQSEISQLFCFEEVV